MMRNMIFSHVDDDGLSVFVPTELGRELIAAGQVGDVTCPTGEVCKQACACSGVSASGVVGVGAKCKCITILQPPNPSDDPGLRFTAADQPRAMASTNAGRNWLVLGAAAVVAYVVARRQRWI